MPKRWRTGAIPVQVTAWGDVFVEDGTVYVAFWSGPQAHVISMGPCKVYQLRELTKRALATGGIMPIRPSDAPH